MERRLELEKKLMDVIGSKNVYFEPPPTYKIKYPCIIFKKTTGTTWHANNMPYMYRDRYRVIYITRDPDSDIPAKIAWSFPMCSADTFYTSNNLNHYPFNLYF